MTIRWLSCVTAALFMLAATACSPKTDDTVAASAAATPTASAATPNSSGLTPFELEHGIGPIKSPVVLAPAVDKTLAEGGEKVFEQKCSACHKLTERYVGPALGDVIKRRSPAFVMNMALNPMGMVEKHPVTKKLLAEYFVAMPNQNITPEQARQVLEYLRSEAHEAHEAHESH